MVDMAFIRLELSFPALFCVASFRITQAHPWLRDRIMQFSSCLPVKDFESKHVRLRWFIRSQHG